MHKFDARPIEIKALQHWGVMSQGIKIPTCLVSCLFGETIKKVLFKIVNLMDHKPLISQLEVSQLTVLLRMNDFFAPCITC